MDHSEHVQHNEQPSLHVLMLEGLHHTEIPQNREEKPSNPMYGFNAASPPTIRAVTTADAAEQPQARVGSQV